MLNTFELLSRNTIWILYSRYYSSASIFRLRNFKKNVCVRIKTNPSWRRCSHNGFLTENNTNKLREYINSDVFPATFKGFSPDAVKELIFWIKVWNKFCLLNPNQRVRILGRRMFFSGKSYFMRMCMILGIMRNETEIQVDTVKQACFDCIHFCCLLFRFMLIRVF